MRMERFRYSLCSAFGKLGQKTEKSKENGKKSESCRIRKNWWQQDISKKEYALAIGKSMLIVGLISFTFYARWWSVCLLMPLAIYLIRFFVYQQVRKKKKQFERQFQDALQSLQAQLNVGYSMENAIKEVYRDLVIVYEEDTMIVKEFCYMVRQLNLNITAEQAWKEFAQRVDTPEADSFVTVFVLSKRSGGDSVSVIKNAIRQLTDKAEVKREIEMVITGKRLEFYVMTFIPFGMILYMRLCFPEFMGNLYGTIKGVCFMSICLGIYFAAWALGCRIVEIEV